MSEIENVDQSRAEVERVERAFAALESENADLRSKLAAIDTYVRSVHNGYSEDARKAMSPNLKEPASTLDAIRELVEEGDELAESQLTELRAACEAPICKDTTQAFIDYWRRGNVQAQLVKG
jgi:predicted nuclease with TOPRIM domain